MSTNKTKIDQEKVISFLKDHFAEDSSQVTFIAGGESSQAFGFVSAQKEYIIRINRDDESFRKDKYVYDHFGSSRLPIPRIFEIGSLDDQFFAISEKINGRLLKDLSDTGLKKILSDQLEKLELIHSANIENTSGYGKWNAEGKGEHNSWREFILSLRYYEHVFPERDIWNPVYTRIEERLKFCPEERHLVHGDFGYDNALSDGARITGVIDWGESLYGDPLYDIAWVNFWASAYLPVGDFAAVFKEHGERKGLSYTDFTERVRCYELFVGLMSLGFYAFSEQRTKYDFTRTRLLLLL